MPGMQGKHFMSSHTIKETSPLAQREASGNLLFKGKLDAIYVEECLNRTFVAKSAA